MKVRPSVKKMCEKCKIIKRHGRIMLSAQILNINKDKARQDGGVSLYGKNIWC